MKIEFSPESLADLEKMAEEMGKDPQELINEINELFVSGKMFEQAVPVDMDSLDPELRDLLEERSEAYERTDRRLN